MPEYVTFLHEDINGVEIQLQLPAKYVVCLRCQGRGTHVNPAIDEHGICEDEWSGPSWSEDEKKAYLNSWYDITCLKCSGMRVTLEVDEAVAEERDPAILKLYHEKQREDAEYGQLCRM